MATKKKPTSSKLPAVLVGEAVKQRQKELKALAKAGGPSLNVAETSDNCRWVPEDVIVIGPTGVPQVETRWRRVCT